MTANTSGNVTVNAGAFTKLQVIAPGESTAAGSAFDRAFNQLWRPLAFEPSNMTRNFHWLVSFARLKPGVSFEHAQADLNQVAANLQRLYPADNKESGIIADPLGRHVIGGVRLAGERVRRPRASDALSVVSECRPRPS